MRNPHFKTENGFIRVDLPTNVKPARKDFPMWLIALVVLVLAVCAGTLDSWAAPANQSSYGSNSNY